MKQVKAGICAVTLAAMLCSTPAARAEVTGLNDIKQKILLSDLLAVKNQPPEWIEIMDYDQRTERVGGFMDEADYTDTKDSFSAVSQYRFLPRNTTEPSLSYFIDTKQGQVLKIRDMTDPSIQFEPIKTGNGQYSINNLIPFHIYQVRLENHDGSEVLKEYIRPIGATNILSLPTMPNTRDIGGMKTEYGTIRYGMIYRGIPLPLFDVLSEEAVSDCKTLRRLGIQLEIDLRAENEIDYTQKAQQTIYGESGVGTMSQIPGARYVDIPFTSYYRAVDFNDYKHERTVIVLREIIESVNRGEPVLFHCSGGADRTGTIAFLIEGLLGVSESDLDKEYELTSFAGAIRLRTNPGYMKMREALREYRGNSTSEKFYNWYLDSGFTEKELQEFIRNMTIPDSLSETGA